MAVKTGSKVKVEYTGKLKDGTVFDRSEQGKPLEFTLGQGTILPDFEKAVEDMKVGEEKTVSISSGKAYGNRDESLIRKFSRSTAPEGFKPEKGMVINLFLPGGESLPATIVGVNDTDIVVDLNHPLAGKDLTFDLKLVDIDNKE